MKSVGARPLIRQEYTPNGEAASDTSMVENVGAGTMEGPGVCDGEPGVVGEAEEDDEVDADAIADPDAEADAEGDAAAPLVPDGDAPKDSEDVGDGVPLPVPVDVSVGVSVDVGVSIGEKPKDADDDGVGVAESNVAFPGDGVVVAVPVAVAVADADAVDVTLPSAVVAVTDGVDEGLDVGDGAVALLSTVHDAAKPYAVLLRNTVSTNAASPAATNVRCCESRPRPDAAATSAARRRPPKPADDGEGEAMKPSVASSQQNACVGYLSDARYTSSADD